MSDKFPYAPGWCEGGQLHPCLSPARWVIVAWVPPRSANRRRISYVCWRHRRNGITGRAGARTIVQEKLSVRRVSRSG
jgi:hypothetical protein